MATSSLNPIRDELLLRLMITFSSPCSVRGDLFFVERDTALPYREQGSRIPPLLGLTTAFNFTMEEIFLG